MDIYAKDKDEHSWSMYMSKEHITSGDNMILCGRKMKDTSQK